MIIRFMNIVQNILKNEISCYLSNLANSYRYYDQDMFNMLNCGGKSIGLYIRSEHEV